MTEQLYDEAYRFDFFQAVRVLNRIALSAAASGAPRSVIGHDAAPSQEAARFRALPSHSFPPSSITEIRLSIKPRPSVAPLELGPAVAPVAPQQDAPTPTARSPVATLSGPPLAALSGPMAAAAGPPEVTQAFLGLTGPNGALPAHYTTLLIERVRAKDFALRDFLDLFNHRVASLFYRAWQKYRFPFVYEQACWSTKAQPEDLVSDCLCCLLGLGTPGLRGRLSFDDEGLLFYAGHFAHFPRSAIALEQILADYFELPITLGQFHGQWLYLTADNQSSLPCPRWPQGLNSQLGATAIIGERVWDVEGKFRARVGPLGYAAFRRLMPSGDVLRPLSQMIRTYAGAQFEFDVQVVLKAPEVPPCILGADPANPSLLGWNT